MTIIKWYTALFALSMLVWHPVWSAEKYILPIVPFLILMIWRAVDGRNLRLRRWWRMLCLSTVAALLLSNAIYISIAVIKNIDNNVHYLKGDRYAGYPPHVRAMFEEFERARGLPDSVRLICRKPELLWLVSGRQSEYPKGVVR